MEIEQQPKLGAREPMEERRFVSREILDDDEPQRFADLPWYAIFRIPLGHLITMGTILISVAGGYAKVREHDQQIAQVKSESQTKEAASAEGKLILNKLESLEAERKQDRGDFIDRFDRIEDRLDDRGSDREHRKGHR